MPDTRTRTVRVAHGSCARHEFLGEQQFGRIAAELELGSGAPALQVIGETESAIKPARPLRRDLRAYMLGERSTPAA